MEGGTLKGEKGKSMYMYVYDYVTTTQCLQYMYNNVYRLYTGDVILWLLFLELHVLPCNPFNSRCLAPPLTPGQLANLYKSSFD